MHILHDKEILLNNQELRNLLIISIILITLMFDSGVIMWGEIRCLSLRGVKGLKQTIKIKNKNKNKTKKQKQKKVGGVQNKGEETTIMSGIGGKVLFTWGKD